MKRQQLIKPIKKFLFDVFLMVRLSDLNLIDSKDSEYYTLLYVDIQEFSKTHQLFMLYCMDKISFKALKKCVGSSDRSVYRYLSHQSEIFINYITTCEQKLDKLIDGITR